MLDDLPKTLDETYGRTLLGIDEEKREYAQRLFRCLAVSIRPLRVEEPAEVLAIRFPRAVPPTFNAAWRPENAEEAVLSACSSLIAVVDRGGHQVVQFSHFSVKEYLTSERLATAEEPLSYYHILPELAHIILAHASLSILLQPDDKIDRDTISHFPLAPHAARQWSPPPLLRHDVRLNARSRSRPLPATFSFAVMSDTFRVRFGICAIPSPRLSFLD